MTDTTEDSWEPGSDDLPPALNDLLDEKSILQHESIEHFRSLFELLKPCVKPHTAIDHLRLFDVTLLTWEVKRYNLLKVSILTSERRAAVESLLLRLQPGSAIPNALPGIKAQLHEKVKRYFVDEEFQEEILCEFDNAGFAPDAVETEAFLRALPLLKGVETLIASSQKRLNAALRDLEKSRKQREAELRAAVKKATGS